MNKFISQEKNNNFSKNRSIRFGFILSPYFTLNALSNFIDVIEKASRHAKESTLSISIEWDVISHDYQEIKSSSQLCILPTRLISSKDKYDYLIVVGGLLSESNRLNKVVTSYIQSFATTNTVIVGICTGTFILARLGLLESTRVCVSWFHSYQFSTEFPNLRTISDRLYHIETRRITCAGGVATLHLAAHLVERYLGRYTALNSIRELESEFPLPPSSLQPTPVSIYQTQNTKLKKAILHFEQRLQRSFSIHEVASDLNVSTRHLERLFMRELKISPSKFYLKLRLNHAYELVKNSNYSISHIAFESGFSDLPYFCRCFKDEFGSSASSLRKNALKIKKFA